ncbi:MAG: hypothetical protein GX567_19710 [Clostridia bacterium]|nr:hypothetical protein [Clostridia bacterium]
MTLTTHYTVADVGEEDGGAITLAGTATPATAADIYTLYRSVPIQRTSNYATAGDFKAATVNREFQRLFMIAQEIRRDIDRALTLLPSDDSTTPVQLPAKSSRAGKVLGFDEDGAAIVSTYDLADIEGSAQAAASAAAAAASAAEAASYVSQSVETFAAGVDYTKNTTAELTLVAAVSEAAVIVTFDGVTQHHNTYSISGTTLTFDAAIPADSVEVTYGTRSTSIAAGMVSGLATVATSGSYNDLDDKPTTGGAWEFVSGADITAVTNIDITGLAAGYDYLVSVQGCIPATDSVTLEARFSQDNGSTFLATSGDYADNQDNVDSISATGTVGNETTEGCWIDIVLLHPNNSGSVKAVYFVGCYGFNNGTTIEPLPGGRLKANTNAVNALRLFWNGGGFQATGKIYVFRRKLS